MNNKPKLTEIEKYKEPLERYSNTRSNILKNNEKIHEKSNIKVREPSNLRNKEEESK